MLEMANHRLYPFWGHLTEALRTGEPQNEIKSGGPGLFESLYADPARLKQAAQPPEAVGRPTPAAWPARVERLGRSPARRR